MKITTESTNKCLWTGAPPSSTTSHRELRLTLCSQPMHSPPASLPQKHKTKQKPQRQTNQKNTNNLNSDLALRGLQLTPGRSSSTHALPPPCPLRLLSNTPSPGSCLSDRATGKAFCSTLAGTRSQRESAVSWRPPGPAPLTSATTVLHRQLLPAAFCWLLLHPSALCSGHQDTNTSSTGMMGGEGGGGTEPQDKGHL